MEAQVLSDVGDFFTDEPEYYEENNFVIQAHIGLFSPLKMKEWSQEINNFSVESSVPAVGLTFEKNIIGNLGIGVTGAFQQWRVPVLGYHYRYYAGSVRAAYHFAIHDRLDPYLGAAATYRRMSLSSGDSVSSNDSFTAHLFFGVRYYLGRSFGLFTEIGSDALTYTKFGISLYLP